MLRTSERALFQRCQWAWWQAIMEGLVPRGSVATHFWFGTGIHLALALWYCGPGKKRGPHPADTWLKYAEKELHFIKSKKDLDEGIEQKYIDSRELGEVMLRGYVEKYGRDEHMYILQPEQTFSLDIPWPDPRPALFAHIKRKLLTRYVGTYDLAWRNLATDWLLLEEHKTAMTVRTDHLTLDNQGGSYWTMAYRTLLSAGLIKPGDRLRGIEYNFLRKALPDPRPTDAEGYYLNKPLKADYIEALLQGGVRAGAIGGKPKALEKLKIDELKEIAEFHKIEVLGARSKVQAQPLFERHVIHRTSKERRTQLIRIQQEAMSIEVVRSGILPPTKSPTRSCSWDCMLFTMCELHEQGGDWESFRDLQFRRRDWYADHRQKSTEE
jgi:hypothetical protein